MKLTDSLFIFFSWTKIKPGESPYHTIHPGDTILDSWNALSGLKQIRSNSWSDSLDDFRFGTPGVGISSSVMNNRPLPGETNNNKTKN